MKGNRSTYITLGVLLLIILLAAWGVWYVSKKQNEELVSPTDTFDQMAASMSFTDLNGARVTLAQFEGDVLVVNSWASWCPFCVKELPDFARLAREYADEDVTVLAINRAEPRTLVKDYLATLRDVDDLVFLLDEYDSYYKFIGAFTMPETVFYKADGTVHFHKRGFMTLEEMRIHVEDTISASQ